MPGLFDILNAWCSIQLTDCLTSLVLSILPNYCIFHKGFVNDFWIQKLHHFYDFRIQIFVGPFSQFLAPETSVFLRCLDPEIAPCLQFLDPEIFWSIFRISGFRNRSIFAFSRSRICTISAISGLSFND